MGSGSEEGERVGQESRLRLRLRRGKQGGSRRSVGFLFDMGLCEAKYFAMNKREVWYEHVE
jgi:hypothetical protein